jgi:ATP-dependent DNA helicase RecG
MARRRTSPLDPPSPAGTGRRLDPQSPVQYLRGVGPARASMLARLGVATIYDLLLHLPRRHEDRRNPTPLAMLTEGSDRGTVARVERIQMIRTRRGGTLVRAGVADATGVAHVVWFNQPYLARNLSRGQKVSLYGRVERAGRGLQFVAPEVEVIDPDDEPWLVGRLVPVYALTEGLPQRTLRTIVREALESYADSIPDSLPDAVRRQHRLTGLREALWAAHFPEHEAEQEGARRRLAFEELLVLQIGILQQRRDMQAMPREAAYGPAGDLLPRFLKSLPFSLTGAQQRAVDRILHDMRQTAPMNRLLQGDVGSGKTVVAVAAIVACIDGGYQAVLMAPTEILAEQHALTLGRMLGPAGIEVYCLSAGTDAAERDVLLRALRSGRSVVVVGTHALLEDRVSFDRLGLVVVDEQHRFGVMQRARLRAKGRSPDVLVMTATPIPRTLTLTVYGDLDVTVIDEMPAGRHPVKTHVRPTASRAKVYAYVREQVREGRQAYIVCPLIEESETLQTRSAVELARELSEGPLHDVRVEVLHGRLSAAQKAERMEGFRTGRVHVLVATTVIEVGIDVPNASIMVIEDADRYGLAQLHQLRGRVGRGPEQSHCILLADTPTEAGRRRVDAIASTTDGFVIAQEDLALRGPGDILGVRQHGLAGLRVADLATDLPLLEEARTAAEGLLQDNPRLDGPELLLLTAAVERQQAERRRLASVG